MGNMIAEIAARESTSPNGQFNLKRVLMYGWDGSNPVRLLVDANGGFVSGGYGTIGTFIKNVTTAGTALQISASSVPCKKVVLNARLGNTNSVVVGDSSVVAADATQRGIVLVPGNNPVTIEIDDLNKLYVDSQTNGDGVCGAYFV